MHTKIPTSQKNSTKATYSNTGSSARLTRYMAKEFPTDGVFFNELSDKITKENVIQSLDNNVKGLKKDEDKFHAFIVSPSNDELTFIGDDEESLKAFAIEAMKEYVEGFNFQPSPSNIFYGKVLEIGEGFYPNPNGSLSKDKVTFLKIKDYNTNKSKVIWGNHLVQLMKDENISSGDFIKLENQGKEIVKTPYYNKKDELMFRESERNKWDIKNISEEQVIEGIKPIRKDPPLTLADFLWYGCIHHSREYSQNEAELSKSIANLKAIGLDENAIFENYRSNLPLSANGIPPSLGVIKSFYRTGIVKEGELKKGLNSHIHIVVSSRSSDMTKTFHPNPKSGFRKKDFFIGVEQRFINLFGYDKQNQTEYKFIYQKTENSLIALQKKFNLDKSYFDPQDIMQSFLEAKDKPRFTSNIQQLGRLFSANKFIDEPKEFLINNRSDFRNREERRSIGSNRISIEPQLSQTPTNVLNILSSFGNGSQAPVFQTDNPQRRKNRKGRSLDDKENGR